MSPDDFDLAIDPALDARLRGSLNTVAATIIDASPLWPEATRHVLTQTVSVRTRQDRRKRRRWLAIGLAAAVVPVAAFSTVTTDFGDVGRIPPKTAFVSGSEDGERYWLVPAVHKDACGKTFGGVELAFERADAPGRGKVTSGVAWGEAAKTEAPGTGCYVSDEARWLADPGRVDELSQRLGGKDQDGGWITMIAVHPTSPPLRVTDDAHVTRDLPTYTRPDRPDGPRYAVFTTPARKPQNQPVRATTDHYRLTRHQEAPQDRNLIGKPSATEAQLHLDDLFQGVADTKRGCP